MDRCKRRTAPVIALSGPTQEKIRDKDLDGPGPAARMEALAAPRSAFCLPSHLPPSGTIAHLKNGRHRVAPSATEIIRRPGRSTTRFREPSTASAPLFAGAESACLQEGRLGVTNANWMNQMNDQNKRTNLVL